MAMETNFDAIVIGAGFAGAATAYHLSQSARCKILILEQESAPGRHSSGKNGALLRQAVDDDSVVALVQETLRALESPPQDWPRKHILRRSGSLLLGETRALQGFAELLEKNGVMHQLHGRESFPENIQAKFRDQLRAAKYESLLFTPGDGVVDIAALLENYLDAARMRGAEVRCEAEVRGLRRSEQGWHLMTPQGALRTRAVINAAGAWAGALGLAAGIPDRGLESFRRHLFIGHDAAPDLAQPYLWDTKHGFYFRPDPQGLLLCAGDEDLHPDPTPSLDERVQGLLREKLRAYFPALKPPEIRRAWACLRSFCRDAPFLIEEEAAASGYFWVAGLGGHGMGSSFGAGRRAAERVLAFLNRQKS